MIFAHCTLPTLPVKPRLLLKVSEKNAFALREEFTKGGQEMNLCLCLHERQQKHTVHCVW